MNGHISQGTYDGTDIKIYINNVLAATKNWPSDLSFSTQPIQLGIFSSFFWEGELDEVRVYSRILNTEEIDALYNFSNPVTETANAETGTLPGLYPVPAISEIKIPEEIETVDSEAKILKTDGTLLSTTNLDGSHELQVQNLDQGMYILRIMNEKSSFTGRFVKE
jgi:hypothetical protein